MRPLSISKLVHQGPWAGPFQECTMKRTADSTIASHHACCLRSRLEARRLLEVSALNQDRFRMPSHPARESLQRWVNSEPVNLGCVSLVPPSVDQGFERKTQLTPTETVRGSRWQLL
ncbi:hypothetical protein PAXRUDRAFT_412612 [Paxillus rubicundulus Ve08.2h10]|uniref:Uncharacterized protein n=1 Tax=Paxillus rubicundulus Ve08.2h10 TaxID=930991 RepID=A0A0D0E2U0_9AGAM|nr:hypothetical protein PAXRUDRAFT_412612 [Paxillus rubicundulus Ve08.2h10]